MNKHPFDTLSADQRENVRSALVAAFGSAPIGAVMPITGGASTASTFRVEVGGRGYLLRVEGQPSPLRNPLQYVSMRIAAGGGDCPGDSLHRSDRAGRGDRLHRATTAQHLSGGPPTLARALGELISRVQATPCFPFFVNYADIVARLFAHVRRTGLFAEGVLDSHVKRLEQLREAYDAGLAGLVSSHNDPVPSNILFDGERLWLIDWESAYRNDPLVDVAIVLDNLARSPELETVLLEAWLGRTPDEALWARLAVTRALTRLYYAGVVLSASAAASWMTGDTDLSAPTPAELQQAVRAGRLKPGAPQTKHVLGKMLLASFMFGVATPGFDAAV
jgi:hypothetical protein